MLNQRFQTPNTGEQQRFGRGEGKRNHLDPVDYEELMRWRLITALVLVYAFSLLAGLIGYGVTKDIHFLWFIMPTALTPFLRLLVPIDKRKLELERIRVDVRVTSAEYKLHETQVRLQQLETRLRKYQERFPSK